MSEVKVADLCDEHIARLISVAERFPDADGNLVVLSLAREVQRRRVLDGAS